MKTVAVIPARWASTRFEGKVLADINGKPMIEHVWRRVKEAQNIDEVLIACDDEKVKNAAENFGASVVMTSPDHPSGSDRIAEAVKDSEAEIILNVQGDEPLIDPKLIDELTLALQGDDSSVMATAIKLIDNDEDLENPNVVKAVVDKHGHALYFSRSTIPYDRDGERCEAYKHLGIYAYRREFLLEYVKMPQSVLEKTERLEQLRVLENGFKIKTIVTDMETIGVDTPEDLEKVLDKLS